jgi:hypothetical protein
VSRGPLRLGEPRREGTRPCARTGTNDTLTG